MEDLQKSKQELIDEINRLRALVAELRESESKHKDTEEALRLSQRQLAISMDMAQLVHWEFDIESGMFTFDDHFYALYGTSAENEGGTLMSARTYADKFVHPDEINLVADEVQKAINATNPNYSSYVEHRIIRVDGEERYIAVRLKIIKDASGRTIKTYGANQDITEWKRALNNVEESSERFHRLFDESPLGMALAGPDLYILKANDAFCKILGYLEHELYSHTCNDFILPGNTEEGLSHVDKLTRGIILTYRSEHLITRKDGEDIWGSITAYATHNRENHLLNYFILLEDITQQKRSEEEKTHLESQLLRAQKMEAIGTLTGGIAHDLNNILTALVGYAGLLQMKMEKGVLYTYVDQILSAAQKATDLVRGLSTFSRQQPITIKPVRIDDIIKGTRNLLERLLTENIAIKTMLNADSITIMVDTTQIDQILFNLATNARDAMPNGGILTIETKRVELDNDFLRLHGYGKPGEYLLLSVSDNGSGMDETTRERIFDPFFTTKETGKGTGLGLSTVYGIVKQHQGYINVYSEINRGTVFHIYFPAFGIALKEEESSQERVRGGNETILVAEDNQAVRDLIKLVLTEYGYTVIEAIDGIEAVEQFMNAGKVDLVILDSVMPGKSGREAYDEMRRLKPDTRVLFMSGYTRDTILDRGIEDDKYDFIAKPIAPNALLQKIRGSLDKPPLRKNK